MLKLRKILLCNKLYLIILGLSIVYFVINTIIIKYSSIYSNETNFRFMIVNYSIDGNKLSIELKDKETVIGNYIFSSEEEKNTIEKSLGFGYRITLIGELSDPLDNTIPNTFNYKKYLYNKKIYKLLKIEKITDIKSSNNIFYGIKNSILNRLNDFESAPYLKTFIMGIKSDIDSEVMDNYKLNGITHLFAISGMHISLFSVILDYLLKKIKVSENKRFLIVMVFLLFYVFLTNCTSSILRASMFFFLISLNKIFYTNVKTINILLLSLSILIFINPFILYDIGFQYSFITSAGLIIGSNFINKSNNYYIKLLKVSLIAMLFSFPISAINFYEINLLSIINNIIFVPIVTIVLYPLSLVTFIFSFLDPFYLFLTKVFEILSRVCNIVNLSIIIPKYSELINIIYYLNLVLLLISNKTINYVMIIISIITMKLSYLDSSYKVYFIDVNQGDSSLIVSPYNKEVIMIDTGGKTIYEYEDWEKRNKTYFISDNIITFLHSLNISNIDLLILSHGDEDHAGETIHLSKTISIKNIILNNYDNYLESNIRKKLNVVKSYKPKYINISNYQLSKYNEENDDSIITIVNINNTNILYMGDAPKKKEKELMNKYKLKVDIIKLGHHGSKTSSDYNFLEKINPSLAIISSGRNNLYKHPSKATLNTLSELKIPYLNTQDAGTILIRFSNAYTIETSLS